MRKCTTVFQTVQSDYSKTWNAIVEDTGYQRTKSILRLRIQIRMARIYTIQNPYTNLCHIVDQETILQRKREVYYNIKSSDERDFFILHKAG